MLTGKFGLESEMQYLDVKKPVKFSNWQTFEKINTLSKQLPTVQLAKVLKITDMHYY